MNSQVQFITNEKGERTGVLLDIEMYHQLVSGKTADSEYLIGLSTGELEALSESKLALNQQARLDELLEKQKSDILLEKEVKELDQLLIYIDQLTILKTRAQYTLRKMPLSTPTE